MLGYCTTESNAKHTKHLDKFYTKPELAAALFRKVQEYCVGVDWYVEPSAGNGSFYNLLPEGRRKGYDIAPECEGVIQLDFLTTDDSDLTNVCYVGNPPFGFRNQITYAFLNHMHQNPNTKYVAMVLPLTLSRLGIQYRRLKNWRLLYECPVPRKPFLMNGTEYPYIINSCFQIYEHKPCSIVIPENRWFTVARNMNEVNENTLGIGKVYDISGTLLELPAIQKLLRTYSLEALNGRICRIINPTVLNFKELWNKGDWGNIRCKGVMAGANSLNLQDTLLELARIDT